MGVRLVYGLKTDDVSYLETFYPARRLAEAASALGLDYAATIHGPGAKFEQSARFCEGHTALLRGDLPVSLFEFMESRGIRVVNGSVATELAGDKWKFARWCSATGTAHPETLLIIPSDHHPPMAYPFIIKPRFGKMGRGVLLVESEAEWSALRESGELAHSGHLAQEYVAASRGRDIRFFFAGFGDGGKMAPVCVIRQGHGLTSNAHGGGSMSLFDAPPALRSEAERIFTASGLIYGTVDFLFLDERSRTFTVCEINANPGFEALEQLDGIDAARAILQSLAGPEGSS